MGVRGGSPPERRAELAVDVAVAVDPSFDAFYRSEYVSTVRLARLLTGDRDTAEDLAHEAFLRLHRTHPTLTTLDNPAAYLHTTTVNLCHNHHRSHTRETTRLRRLDPPPTEHTPHTTRDDELTTVIAGLPYRQRAVLVLRYWLDLTETDIAQRLGCRPGTVKSLHSRALTHIRTEIAP